MARNETNSRAGRSASKGTRDARGPAPRGANAKKPSTGGAARGRGGALSKASALAGALSPAEAARVAREAAERSPASAPPATATSDEIDFAEDRPKRGKRGATDAPPPEAPRAVLSPAEAARRAQALRSTDEPSADGADATERAADAPAGGTDELAGAVVARAPRAERAAGPRGRAARGAAPASAASAPRAAAPLPREPIYLASQLASICDVDLKTIHNWCDRPSNGNESHALECFRTPGGHLRFRHSAILRFLNRWGYPIPDSLLRDRPHLLIVEPERAQRQALIAALGLTRPGDDPPAATPVVVVADEFARGLAGAEPKATRGHKQPLTPASGVAQDPTAGLFASDRWYVHLWDDAYAALVAVGERTGADAAPDLAVLPAMPAGIEARAWMRAVRHHAPALSSLHFALVGEGPEAQPLRHEPGVVALVPPRDYATLRTVLDDEAALWIAVRGEAGAGATALNLGEPRRRRAPIAPREPIFVASQVAQIWDVDLKTVHNWVERGEMEAFCTPGRHLRFRRRSLLHFLRRYNMAIPEELAPARPRICIVDVDRAAAEQLARALGELFEVTLHTDPVAALVSVGTHCSGAGLIDAIVVTFPVEGIDDRRWIEAVSRHPDTRYTRVVVVAGDDLHRRAWQDLGAIATVRRESLEQLSTVLERALGLETGS